MVMIASTNTAGHSSSRHQKNSDGIARRQWAFTLFVLFETGWCRSKDGSSTNTVASRCSHRRHSCDRMVDQRAGHQLNGYYLRMIVAGIGAQRHLRHLRRQ
jgi:hypothetical protein